MPPKGRMQTIGIECRRNGRSLRKIAKKCAHKFAYVKKNAYLCSRKGFEHKKRNKNEENNTPYSWVDDDGGLAGDGAGTTVA